MKKIQLYIFVAMLVLPMAVMGFSMTFNIGGTTIGTGENYSNNVVVGEEMTAVPSSTPGGSGLNHIYIRNAGITACKADYAQAYIEGYEKLSWDLRSSSSNSQTWVLVVASTIGSSLELSWELDGVDSNNESLKMEDAEGTLVVPDMAAENGLSVTKGIYYIKYAKGEAVEAPATPEAVDIEFLSYEGNVIEYDTGNANIYDVSAVYFDGKRVCTSSTTAAEDERLNVVDGKVFFTVPASCHDVNIYYTMKNSDDANAGTARGVIHLKEASGSSLLRLASDGVVSVRENEDEQNPYKSFTVRYVAHYLSDQDIKSPNFSVYMPKMESENYGQYWCVSATVNGEDAEISEAQEIINGSMKQDKFDVTYPNVSQETFANSYEIELTITPKAGAKNGSISASINGGEEVSDVVLVKFPGNNDPIVKEKSSCEQSYDENESRTIEFSATFQDSNENNDASGIKNISLDITIDGKNIDGSLWSWSKTALPTAGTGEATVNVNLTLAPTLLDGAERDASGNVCITVTLTDGENNIASYDLWQFILMDTDRAPEVTGGITITGKICGNDVSSFGAQAQDVEDPDGDAVYIRYDFSIGTSIKSVTCPMNEACPFPEGLSALKRGDMIAIQAYSISKPAYKDEDEWGAESDGYCETTVVVSNSAPTRASQSSTEITFSEYSSNQDDSTAQYGDSQQTKDVAYFATFSDIDGDSLTYSIVDNNISSDVAEISCSGNQVVFNIKEHKVLDNENATFCIQATDGYGESAKTEPIKLVITGVNDKPTVMVSDIYLNPLDFSGEQRATAWSAFGGISQDEAGQTLSVSTQSPELSGDLAEKITGLALAVEDGKVVATYTLAEIDDMAEIASLIDKQAVFSFTVTDDGEPQQTSSEYTIVFHVSSTPWYPAFAIGCTEHKSHQVVLTCGDKTWTIDNVSGDLKPGDYFRANCDGLAAGTTWSVAVHPILEDAIDESVDCVAEDASLTVGEYDAPATPNLEFEETSPGRLNLTVQAPLAASYRLSLYNVKYTKPVHVTENAFEPNENGFIASVAEIQDSIRNPGTYYYTLVGINPEGESEEYQRKEFYSDGYFTPLSWPEDGEFTPASGQVLTTADCIFSWPKPVTAVGYVLYIEDISAGTVTTVHLEENEYNAQLEMSSSNQRFLWWVVALDEDGNRLTSTARQFSVVTETELAVVDGTTVVADGETISFNLVATGEALLPTSAEIQLAHNNGDGTFTYYKYKGNDALKLVYLDEESASITLSGAVIAPGDLLSIRLCKDRVKGKYSYYNVK